MSRNYSYKYKCCVPGCMSRKEKYGSTAFSLHEFPARSPARELWIEAVRKQFPDEERQKNWHPQQRTKVCSLHFSPDQYRETEKTKRVLLKSESIPHIFIDQNSSKNGNLENESDLLPLKFSKNINVKWVKKPKFKWNDIVPTAVNRNIKAHSSPKINTLPAVSSCLQNANNHISSHVSDLVVDSCSSGVFENSGSTLNSGTAENENIHTHFDTNLLDQNLSKDQPVSNGLSGKQDVCRVSSSWLVKELITQSCGTQTMNMVTLSCETQTMNMITRGTQTRNLGDKACSRSVNTAVHSGALKRKHENEDGDHLKKHRRTVNKLKARILSLEQQNKNLKKLNQGMNESLNLFNINELEKGITNLNARALFLFEQLNSFAKKKTAWSSSTVEIIDTLEKKFPQSYEYLKQTDIISLPPPKNQTQFQVFEKKS